MSVFQLYSFSGVIGVVLAEKLASHKEGNLPTSHVSQVLTEESRTYILHDVLSTERPLAPSCAYNSLR